MPYGRPIIKSISQNYQEAEVTLFLNLHLTFHFHFLNLHNLLLNLLIQERDVLLSCEVEALGENLVIWKQGDRTISAGSIMVCVYFYILLYLSISQISNDILEDGKSSNYTQSWEDGIASYFSDELLNNCSKIWWETSTIFFTDIFSKEKLRLENF